MKTVIKGKYQFKAEDVGERCAKFTLTNTETGKGGVWRGADTQANNAYKSEAGLDAMIENNKSWLDKE